jgi:hypothetical protein
MIPKPDHELPVVMEDSRFAITGYGFARLRLREDLPERFSDRIDCIDAPSYIARGSVKAVRLEDSIFLCTSDERPV